MCGLRWSTVKVERGLVLEMDKFISSSDSKLFGTRKYLSRSQFVKAAIIKLLEEETKTARKSNHHHNNRVITAEVRHPR